MYLLENEDNGLGYTYGSFEFCGEKYESKYGELFVFNFFRKRWSCSFGFGGLYCFLVNIIKSVCLYLVVSIGIL